MRFPIQFNLSLIKAGLSADERRVIRENIANNMQDFHTVQNRLKRYDVSLPNLFKSKVDITSIYKVNYELQHYKQHGYTDFERTQYNAVIDDLNTIGVYNVDPETLNKISDNDGDWEDLHRNLGEAIFYNELFQETGDSKHLTAMLNYRDNVIDILSKYVSHIRLDSIQTSFWKLQIPTGNSDKELSTTNYHKH